MRFFSTSLATFAAVSAFSSVATAGFVTTKGLQFQLDDKPYTFSGSNLWTFGATDKDYIPATIKAAKSADFSVIRVAAWFMKDPASGLQGTYGKDGENWFILWENGNYTVNTGANGLQLMDQAIKEAEDAGIQLIMCLTNQWKDYGGMMTYVDNLLGPGKSQTEFYTNPTVIDSYKGYVKEIVNRYKHSPAVFAWELANESRCQPPSCTGGSHTLTTWTNTLSTYIKSLDPSHLITTGSVGFFDHGLSANGSDYQYDGFTGDSFDDLLALKNVDFGTVHLYTNDDGANGVDFGMKWLQDHNAAAIKADKPIVLEEVGVNRTSPDLSVGQVLGQYQGFVMKSEGFGGWLDWSALYVNAACPAHGDIYALCANDSFYDTAVLEFGKMMAGKGGLGGQ